MTNSMKTKPAASLAQDFFDISSFAAGVAVSGLSRMILGGVIPPLDYVAHQIPAVGSLYFQKVAHHVDADEHPWKTYARRLALYETGTVLTHIDQYAKAAYNHVPCLQESLEKLMGMM